jgi:Fe-S-cluster containining protein
MSFDCKQCGACCKIAGMIGIIRDADGNKMQREDGACIHLDDNNMCKIYEDRPDICRVKEDLNGGYAKTMKVCNDIQPLVNGSNEKLYDI